MNTNVHVVVVGGCAAHLQQAETAVRDREARWSRFLVDSELSQLNANPGRPFVVSPDTYDLIALAVAAQETTNGAFDPTVLSCLIQAGYDQTFDQLASADSDSRVNGAGSVDVEPAPTPRSVVLDDGVHAIHLPPGVGLDLGGIAKGATADVVVSELMSAGAAGCCVNVGGDVRIEGRGPDGHDWIVAIDCPGSVEQRSVKLAHGAVCTSTTTKRRWAGSDGAQHHLRHPTTGRPFDTGLATVTVISARAAQAEILTKAAFAAGLDGAAALLRGYDVTGLLVSDEGEIVELEGFEAFASPAALLDTVGGAQ